MARSDKLIEALKSEVIEKCKDTIELGNERYKNGVMKSCEILYDQLEKIHKSS